MPQVTWFEALLVCIKEAAEKSGLGKDLTVLCGLDEVREVLGTPAAARGVKMHLEALLCGHHSEPKKHLLRALLWVLTALRCSNPELPELMCRHRCADAIEAATQVRQEGPFGPSKRAHAA